MSEDFSKFVHLHCHTDYSLYDGFQKYSSLVARAKELNMKAIAVTDHGKVGSFIKFYKEAKNVGVKPIFGLEAYIAKNLDEYKSERYHLTVLAKNNEGYKNILRIATESHNHIVRVGRNEIPRINWDILKQHSEGLIILSGCIVGQFSKLILEDKLDEAEALAKQYKDVWGEDYYTEIMLTGYEPQMKQVPAAVKIAEKLGLKTVVTNDAHYTYKEDAEYQRTKIAISRNGPLYDTDSGQYYIKSYEEMVEAFGRKPKAIDFIENTVEVADKCDVELQLGAAQLPHFEVPQNDQKFNEFRSRFCRKGDEEIYLIYLAKEGLKWRKLDDRADYCERLDRELETIKFTGFIRYFLIVWEYCHWARENDIMIGDGRGSGAGSLVLYCLGVTNVDPIKYGLTMDRFLYAEANYKAQTDDFFEHVEREENMHGEECKCPTCK